MSGPVSTYLRNSLQSRLQRHRVVVWYDPDRSFESFVQAAELPGTAILTFQDSYFRLRQEAEPLLSDLRSGKANAKSVLLYVPRASLRPEQNVLLPVESLGTTLSTDLSTLARDALKGKLPAEKVNEWRKLPDPTLAKLDALAEGEEDIAPLDVVFGKVGPQEVGYRLLRNADSVEEIKQQKLVEPLRGLLDRTFGVAVGGDVRSAAKLRDAFAQRVLLHEFLDDLASIPSELAHLSLPERPAQIAACRELAVRQRETKPLEEEYRAWAREAVELFGLERVDYDAEQLGRRDTFEFEARYALQHARDLATAGEWEGARRWVADRSRSFWAATDETLRGRWHAMGLAVELSLTVERALKALPSRSSSVAEWVEWYAAPGEGAGWRVDLLLRRMDALAGSLLDQPALEEVVGLARQRATEAEQLMAERFWDRLQTESGDLSGLPLQSDVYRRHVEPLVTGSARAGARAVYVLADALRYEMGHELAELLRSSGTAELGFAVATPPTITKIGMAALTPGAENGLELVPGDGGVIARVAGEALPTLEQRRKRFDSVLGSRVLDLTLDECLSLTSAKLEQKLGKAALVLLRSRDLDAIGELDNLHHARTAMSRVIPDLQHGINRLANVGLLEFIICSDHGFLLREDISDAMKLDPPAGEVLELHRRCAVGRHLAARDNLAVFRAADFGLGGDLELAFPRGINVFRTSGNMAYHHGGVSLQELIVPVLRYTSAAAQRVAAQKSAVEVELRGGKKVTNAIFQVELSYQAGDLFEQNGRRRFRVTAVEAKKEGAVLATTMQASHGFREAGGEVELASGESSMLILYITDPPTGTGELILRVDDVEAGETICQKKAKYEFVF